MIKHGIILGLFFFTFQALGCSEPDSRMSEFRIVGLGQPNTRGHVQKLERVFKNVKIDLMLNRQGILVGAHDLERLALVESGQVADPLTLDDLLSIEFEGIFLDMKNTLPPKEPKDTKTIQRLNS